MDAVREAITVVEVTEKDADYRTKRRRKPSVATLNGMSRNKKKLRWSPAISTRILAKWLENQQ